MTFQGRRLVGALMVAASLIQLPVWAQTTEGHVAQERQSFVQLASEVTPSVVNIDVSKKAVRRASSLPFDDPIFRRFFGEFPLGQDQETVVTGKGSGVIIRSDGLILTNNHVVSGASDVEVTLKDGRQLKATVIGTDPTTDLAVLRVTSPQALPAAKLGRAEDLPIGSWLMAVGNPYGLQETVTVGILSGKGRVIGAGLYDDFLQTDAAINPGNSGGGLFDIRGELVGINTAVAGQNLGFAIPIEIAQRVASELESHGKVVRGYLGVGIQDLTPSLREGLKVPSGIEGALVGQVLDKSPGAVAGLRPGDVVVEFDGRRIGSQRTFLSRVAQAKVGVPTPLKVYRKGQLVQLKVTVGERPGEVAKSQAEPTSLSKQSSEDLGFQVADLTPELAHRLKIASRQGAVVATVRPGSPAARAGLRVGDVILEANGGPIARASDFERALKAGADSVALLIARGDQTVFLGLDRPSE